MSYNTKNYTEQGGDVTHIGGKLVFDEGGSIAGFPGAENFVPKTTNTGADIRSDLNTLIKKLKDAGIMIPDEWNVYLYNRWHPDAVRPVVIPFSLLEPAEENYGLALK